MSGLLAGDLINAYCERAADGVWDEPINVLSSLSFILAAAILVTRLIQHKYRPVFFEQWLLVATLAAIGIGSITWHLFARSWAELTDILPIALFINVFLLSFLVRIAKLPSGLVVGLFILFHIYSFWVTRLFPAEFLNGSMFYAPAWTSLLLVSLYLFRTKHSLARRYALATTLFTVSVFLRSIDPSVCQLFPLGTHFLWHILNATLLYILLLGLVANSAEKDNIIKL